MITDALRDLILFVQFKKRENTHGGVLLLVKLQAEAILERTNIPPWVFLTFFELYKWYRIAKRTTYYLQIYPVSKHSFNISTISL